MPRTYSNTACRLYHTEYCRVLNMANCETCTVAGRSKADMEALVADLDALKALLPEDGVEELFLSDRCILCKKEEPNPRTCYGLLDLGNREPERVVRSAIGLKTKLRAGSLLPVQLAACDACKKRFTKLDYVVSLWVGVAGVLSIALLSYRPLREYFASFFAAAPFLLFVACMLAAWGAGVLIRNSRVKRYAKHTHLDVMEIKKLSELREKGWFELNPNGRYSKLIFSKKRLQQGLYTGRTKDGDAGSQNV
ncbi:MAG: hypothetical protein ABFC62_11090 [Clostridiaceae bacterium]|nr:hypothetical protein [Eubacteriales bacterium]